MIKINKKQIFSFLILIIFCNFNYALRSDAIKAAYQCAIGEPENLAIAKAQVKEYYQSGKYIRDVACIAEQIKKYINSIHLLPPKAAVIFDIDDTVICSFDYSETNDFEYNEPGFREWEKSPKKAIPPMLDLYNFIRNKGIKIFFITGRRETRLQVTKNNLRSAGFSTWEGLYLKPENSAKSNISFKSTIRQTLEEQGYVIIANIGDQESDLKGGYAQKTFKIPNPIYTLP